MILFKKDHGDYKAWDTALLPPEEERALVADGTGEDTVVDDAVNRALGINRESAKQQRIQVIDEPVYADSVRDRKSVV